MRNAGVRPWTLLAPATARATRRRRRVGVQRALYLFAIPAVALYGYFFIMPTVESLQYSVTNWDGISSAQNVGGANFRHLLTDDSLARNALENTLKYLLVVVILQTAISLFFAILLTRNSRSTTWLRALYFFPTTLSAVAVAFIWRFLYDPNFGLINRILADIHLGSLQSPFLGDAGKAIYLVALVQVWSHVGQVMIIFIAGLQQIPGELYESAEIDGSSRWQRFRFITWPMIAPATTIVVAYTMLQSFKAFDLIIGLGGNPPRPSLDVFATRIYTTFGSSQYGYAAAESIVLMVIIGLVTVVQRRTVGLSRRKR